MKKQSSYILSVPAPCHESWENMTPVEQGKFCQSCQKTVTDFSTMSDKDILSFFSNPQKNICGRFHTEQLNREFSIPANKARRPFISIAAVIAALTVAIPLVQAKPKPTQIQSNPDKSIGPQQSDIVVLTGTVKNSVDNSILQRAIVKVKDQAIISATDSTGNYELRIPETVTEKLIVLEVEYPGFMPREIYLRLKSKIATFDILLDPSSKAETVMMGAAVIITIETLPKKQTLWERFKYKVTHLVYNPE